MIEAFKMFLNVRTLILSLRHRSVSRFFPSFLLGSKKVILVLDHLMSCHKTLMARTSFV